MAVEPRMCTRPTIAFARSSLATIPPKVLAMTHRLPLAACAGLILLLFATAACEPSGESASSDSSSGDASEETAALSDAAERAKEARTRLEQSEGGRLVLQAINAHSGLEAWYAAPTSSYTWEYANSDVGLHFESYMVVDNRTRTAYHDLLSIGPFGDPQPVDGAFAWDGKQGWIVPDSIQGLNPHFWATTGYYFEQIPFVLADPGVTYEPLPDATLDGTTYSMVRAG